MPYLHVKIGKPITEAQKDALHAKCAELISIIPDKNADNCMIHIDGNCDMYMKGAKQPCVFVELCLYKESPMEAKRAFVSALCGYLCQAFETQSNLIYMNILEMEHWVVGDTII